MPGADTVDELNCAEGNLSCIVPRSFNLLNRLTELYLYHNNLRSIAPGAFASLLKLTHLSFDLNPKLNLKQPDNLAAIKIEHPEWFIAPYIKRNSRGLSQIC